MKAKGFTKVNLQYKSTSFQATFVVVEQNTESILGIGNIRKLKLDLNSLIHGARIHSVKPYDKLNVNEIINEFKEVFSPGLGHCTKVNAHIQLQDSAIPKIFKPRPVPFARLDKTKAELERLQHCSNSKS